MADPSSFWLGLEFFLGALVVAGTAWLVTRFLPKVPEKLIAIVMGAILGLCLMAKGLYGLPGTDAIKARLIGLIPHAGIALWVFIALRFWLSTRKNRRDLEARLDVLATRAAVEALEKKVQDLPTSSAVQKILRTPVQVLRDGIDESTRKAEADLQAAKGELTGFVHSQIAIAADHVIRVRRELLDAIGVVSETAADAGKKAVAVRDELVAVRSTDRRRFDRLHSELKVKLLTKGLVLDE